LEQHQTAAECVSSTCQWLSNRQVRAESRFSVFLRYSSFLSRLIVSKRYHTTGVRKGCTVRSRYKRQLVRLNMKKKWPTRTGKEDSRPIFFCKRFSYNENALYWSVLRPRICTQKVKSMLGWREPHWPLTSLWKRRLQVAPSVLVLSPPTAVGLGGIPRHVASPDRECSLIGSRGNFRA